MSIILKKSLSLILIFAMVQNVISMLFLTAHAASSGNTIDMSDTSPPASGTGWTYANDVYTITNGAIVTVVGSNIGSQRRIAVSSSATAAITLNNVSVLGLASSQSPFLLNSGANVDLTLIGDNTLTAGFNCAGIQAPDGTTLTINGAGTLTATGGSNSSAIGGGTQSNGGNIKINSGIITAISSIGAGIGGGLNGAGGNIIINGGIITTVTDSPWSTDRPWNAAGIGGGSNKKNEGTFTMNGNAVVFTSSVTDSSSKTKGILFIQNSGSMYGDVTIDQNVTFSSGTVLSLKAGTLTLAPDTILTNNGIVVLAGGNILHDDGVHGTIIGSGEIQNLAEGSGNSIFAVSNIPIKIQSGTNANTLKVTHGGGIEDNIPKETQITIIGSFIGSLDNAIQVFSGVTASIKLHNVYIDVSANTAVKCAFNMTGANVSLELSGENTLKSNVDKAGLLSPEGSSLIINGNGTLIANGGLCGAGIGGGNGDTGGNITINSGSVNAKGGYQGGAGIGGGVNGAGGNIVINGGSIVAVGGDNGGSGIGGGRSGNGGRIEINDGIVTANGTYYSAGIGGGGYGGAGGEITINGGTIMANGHFCGGAGIGGGGYYLGNGGAGGNILITGGNITATGGGRGSGCGGAGIGGGGADYGICGAGGEITITGGTVVARSTVHGAGIGGGGTNSGTGGVGGNVTISDGVVTATGGASGAGIGGGRNAAGGNVTITGGMVTAIGGTYGDNISVAGIGGGYNCMGDTLTMNGNSVAFASSVNMETENIMNGILFVGNNGLVYGDVELKYHLVIPDNYTLTVPDDTSLTIPDEIILTNNGTVIPADGSTVKVKSIVSGKKINGANISTPTVGNPPTQTNITVDATDLSAVTEQDVEYAVSMVNSADPSTLIWQTETVLPLVFTPITSIDTTMADKITFIYAVPQSIAVIIAFYDADGMLGTRLEENDTFSDTIFYIYARSKSNSNFTAGVHKVSAGIITPLKSINGSMENIDISKEADKIKVMLWDGINTRQPLYDAKTIKKDINGNLIPIE